MNPSFVHWLFEREFSPLLLGIRGTKAYQNITQRLKNFQVHPMQQQVHHSSHINQEGLEIHQHMYLLRVVIKTFSMAN